MPQATESERILALLNAQQEASLDGILVVDEARRVRNFNSRFLELWGLDGAMVRRGSREMIAVVRERIAEPERFIAVVERLYAHPMEKSHDRLLFKDGRVVDRYSSPVVGGQGEVFGRVWFFRDVTDQCRAEAELRRLAMIDPMTGIANRRQFFESAQDELARAGRFGRPLGYILADIDNFKAINDSCGHSAGDMVIAKVAQLLAASIRASDMVGRVGGDEFAVLLPEADENATGLIAERARSAVAAQPFAWQGAPIAVTISAGWAARGPDSVSLDTLVQAADRGLYEAKRLGRNRVVAVRPGGAVEPLQRPSR